MRRYSLCSIVWAPVTLGALEALASLAAPCARANDLKELYELALTRDASLQAAGFQRDAAIEAKPQALSVLLPQVSASASAARERAGFDNFQSSGNQAADCAISAAAGSQHCYGTSRALGINMSQTLWSFQAFSQLKEANFQAAAAETAFRGAQQSLVLRVAQAYFAILSASDQLATNRAEREAFGTLLNQAKAREQTGVGPRSDVEQAQAFYDATEQSVIDARNALDDANLALTEIVGPHTEPVAPLREDIPLASPEPASAEDWVVSARQDNFDVRTAQLKMEAASRDISVPARPGTADLVSHRVEFQAVAGRGSGRQSNSRHGGGRLQLASFPRRSRRLRSPAVAGPYTRQAQADP